MKKISLVVLLCFCALALSIYFVRSRRAHHSADAINVPMAIKSCRELFETINRFGAIEKTAVNHNDDSFRWFSDYEIAVSNLLVCADKLSNNNEYMSDIIVRSMTDGRTPREIIILANIFYIQYQQNGILNEEIACLKTLRSGGTAEMSDFKRNLGLSNINASLDIIDLYSK